ncbi:MAG: NAD/NADP octopine/nopaline dehydrogenase family protein [Actinobacteria bacterium]|nr:NAD/NADP octopine/nopaline dehydrogenase family protein [Actinomycetota bacterium]
MRNLIVAVVGGGNGSYTVAGDLALRGHRVRMWPGSREKHQPVLVSRAITVTGLGRQDEGRLELVSEDIGAVVTGADVVVCTDPAFTQEDRAARVAPHLTDGQIVFLSPGSFGSLVFARVVRAQGNPAAVIYAEPGTLPYLTRKTAPTEVQISGIAVHLPVGVFPARATAQTVETLRALFPGAHPVENVLSVALLNVGPIIHSVLVLLNTGAIEHFQRWDIHNEGTTPSVKKVILAHDGERIAVRQALGFGPPHYPIAHHYDAHGDEEWMYGRRGHTDLVTSEKWREPLSFAHRYIREDVHCNLALFSSIGDLAGVETPVADSLLRLVGVITGQNHMAEGRTLTNLGLGELSLSELDRLLQEGHHD